MNYKESILKNIDNNLSNLEKARYIYLELGKILSFSTKFKNTSDKEFINMLHANIKIDEYNINQVNCVIWSSIYSQILNEVGIKNTIEGDYHKYVTFEFDGIKWIADGAKGSYDDLSRIKNNDETMYFGIAQFPSKKNPMLAEIINYEESKDILKKIDTKLGYRNNKMDQLLKFKDFLEQIRNKEFDIKKEIQIEDESNIIVAKLEYLFEKIGTLRDGYYESKDFVRELEAYIFDIEEQQNIHGKELKRTNKNKEVDIIQCIYVKDNNSNDYNYYLLVPNQKIRKVEKEEILALSVLGFGLEEKDKIPGIEYPKNFKLGKTSHKKPMFLVKKGKYKNIIDSINNYDVVQSHTIK